MGLILNIETATSICSVALGRRGNVIAKRETSEPNSHSLLLGSFVEEVMQEAKTQMTDLDAVAVSSGPGSYTGLRIGVSMAKGLSYSLDIPLISIPTLKAMANGIRRVTDYKYLIPMIDARRMEVYAAIYNSDLKEVNKVEPVIIGDDSFSEFLSDGKIVFFGDGATKCKSVITSKNAIFDEGGLPSAVSMCSLSEELFAIKQFENTAYFEPLYLKEFQAKISKVKGLR